MEKLSAVIITFNEERNIGRCLKSLDWVDEIVVVDSGSSDRTVEICETHGAKVVKSEWLGFGKTKHFAVEQAANNWILSIDADEEVTPQLKQKIQSILKNPDATVAYRIKRQAFYLGRPVKHAGWQKDYPLRLFNRQNGNFNDREVHESVEFNGQVQYIQEPLLHYTYPTISSHIQKMDRYTNLTVGEHAQKATILGSVARAFFKFLKMYFLKGGFLDGRIGFVLCFNSAFGIYLKYIKLWEKRLK
ncbi:glycosyl transferase family 2 [Caldithrix abyssi DSM 13497]|uniref:Glycosyl transferase family 2 n=1 Tax=Caldithrix abyssi DSM 13497 TaxID=880073 RepID=H1XSL5_CALAY|nr:glycosyltransferase family 2 protein [Caldithrix abyssi]APF18572.1 Glycosyltransferase involved in cell wall bisynthesis [Caldithrix abyssi DSM 13497]EHO42563.1 glycosyl transferase family 2 [Caldithrix abyssi DSM 13497]